MNTDLLREQLTAAVEPIDRSPAHYRRIKDGITRRRRLRAAGYAAVGSAAAAAVAIVASLSASGSTLHTVTPGSPSPTGAPTTGVASSSGPSPSTTGGTPAATAVAVPDVRGLPLATARQRLESAGLAVTARVQTEQNAAPGSVIAELPVPGSSVAPRSKVLLMVIAAGPGQADVDGDGLPDEVTGVPAGTGERQVVVHLGAGGTLTSAPYAAGPFPFKATPVRLGAGDRSSLLVQDPGGDSVFYRLYTVVGGRLVFVAVPGMANGKLASGGGINYQSGFSCTGGLLTVAWVDSTKAPARGTSSTYQLVGEKLVLTKNAPSHPLTGGQAAIAQFLGNACGTQG